MTERVGRGKMLERTNYKMTNRQTGGIELLLAAGPVWSARIDGLDVINVTSSFVSFFVGRIDLITNSIKLAPCV
jgi:hypothetical protein